MATQSPFWEKSEQQRTASFRDKIASIHRLNDPGTFADEILRYTNILLWVSLLFTAALCYFSYEMFFSRYLSPGMAMFGASCFVVLIEVSKRYLCLYAIRWPLLNAAAIFSSKTTTFLWGMLLAFAITVFGISIHNSTKGAKIYAGNQAFQRTEQTFTANTADLDAQISAQQQAIAAAPTAKWKGKEYYQDPKSVRAAQQALDKMQAQRADQVKQQRADFERSRAQADQVNTESANATLLMGGFIELIQILLMFMMASCESILYDRNKSMVDRQAAAPAPRSNESIGFKTAAATAEVASDRPVIKGFRRPEADNIAAEPVTQLPHPVTQITTHKGMLTGKEADAALKHWFTALQREPSNFKNKHANPQTVGKRVCLALMGMEHTLYGIDSCSAALADEIIRYYEDNLAQPMADNDITMHELPQIWALLRSRATGTEAATA